MLPITRKISAYNHSSGNNIKYIVMHDTGNYKDTASANANYFNGGDRQASAHYFVDDNSIYQVVEDTHSAWHCGDGHGAYGISNHNSVGIEMCNSGGYISETTIKNTLELVKYLMKKYNVSIDRVVRHYDASRKCCPNNMSANNWAKWNEFKSRLSGTKYTAPTSSTTGAGGSYYNVKEVQNMLIKIGYPCGNAGADGIWGNNTYIAVKSFQKDCNLKSDGWVGNDTYHRIEAEYNKKMGIKPKQEVKKEEYDMDILVLYYGDMDALSALIVAQKNKGALMRMRDYDSKKIKAKKIIKIGGPDADATGTDRFETFKAAGKLV